MNNKEKDEILNQFNKALARDTFQAKDVSKIVDDFGPFRENAPFLRGFSAGYIIAKKLFSEK